MKKKKPATKKAVPKPKPKHPRLTRTYLDGLDACNVWLFRFARVFPRGLVLSKTNLQKHAEYDYGNCWPLNWLVFSIDPAAYYKITAGEDSLEIEHNECMAYLAGLKALPSAATIKRRRKLYWKF